MPPRAAKGMAPAGCVDATWRRPGPGTRNSQGRSTNARDLLAPVYEWFPEGFDTQDLHEAKALLEALS